jgi:dihydrofolate reductase
MLENPPCRAARYGLDRRALSSRRQGDDVAKLVYGLQMTLDGYADHTAFNPSAKLFRHFIDHTREVAGSVYGRTMYEVMRYWDDDQPEWEPEEHEYGEVWRDTPKWVVSKTLDSVGPNATLVKDDLEGFIRRLKAEHEGEIEIAGPRLANSVGELGLIDEYRIYLHPVVVGQGKPFFAGPPPALHLAATEQLDDDVIRLTYVPA